MKQIKIDGQDGATVILNRQVAAFAKNGTFPGSLLVFGPAGIGKSHTVRAFIDCLLAEKLVHPASICNVDSCATLATLNAPKSKELIECLKNSALGIPSIVWMDEAQKMSKMGAAMKRIVDEILFGAGEGWNGSGVVDYMGERVEFNRAYLCFILSTNFPDKVETGNSNAVKRRFVNVELVRFRADIMRRMVKVYLAQKGIAPEEKSIGHLEKLHRGTFEALDNVTQKLAVKQGDALKVDDLISILPHCDFTLRGFTNSEVKALRWIKKGDEPATFGNFTKVFPALDLKEFIRHCQAQETKSGGELVATPFCLLGKNQFFLTPTCEKFLDKNELLFDSIP